MRRSQSQSRFWVVEAPYPARTTVGSYLGDFLVEIDAVAAIP